MIKRFSGITAILIALLLWGGLSCGGGGSNTGIFRIEITNCPASLLPGEDLTLTVVATASTGVVISGVTFTFNSSNDRFAFVNAAGLLTALYPGAVSITASAGGVTSGACDFAVNPLPNTGTVTDISNNAVDDNWGMNNDWKMIGEGGILWQQTDVNTDILFHGISDPVGNNTLLKTVAGVFSVDFMALGSGASPSSFLAAWRENMATSFLSDGGTPVNTGSQQSEQNSVDLGCYFYRETGGGIEDVFLFTLPSNNNNISNMNLPVGQPISSDCQAVWLQGTRLLLYNGNSVQEIATGLAALTGEYDFQWGMVVYAKNEDIYLYKLENGETTNITNNPANLNGFPKTDGNSILFTRAINGGADNDVVLYDIASQTPTVISNTDDPKEGNSLEIDLKQATWRETNTLFFHNGNGMTSGTSIVPLQGAMLATDQAYISDGILTWIANDGDDDVYIMQ